MPARLYCLLISIAVLGGLPSPGWAQQRIRDVTGAGATFPALVYSAWASTYSKETGNNVRYSPTGSSDGIKQITERKVDFGATDSPLSGAELKTNKLVQFPAIAGGIVPVVNIPTVANGALKLNGALLADLFSGEIKSWDDARIASLNPSLRLPALRVVPVVRQDGSGTTEMFTTYLAAQSPGWQTAMGVGKVVKWKEGSVPVNGNDAVAENVKKTSGAIGYVSFDRAQRLGLATVALRNLSGKYVVASESAFQAAVKSSVTGKTDPTSGSLLNASSTEAWPITDVTYILMDAAPKSSDKASASAKFFYWAFMKGDELVQGTGFAPLPAAVQGKVLQKLMEIQPADGPIQLFGG